ncbi:MAG: nucleoside hydrolase [Proteobacteria bacterium]|nr:nucleoside hydrolase [Pseudomonadota bacterium]
MKYTVWIDTDCGFDDMAAIAMVADDGNWHILGASLVAGNASLADAIGNMTRMQNFFGWQFPVYAGADKPLIGPLVTAENVLGSGGLGTVGRTLPPARDPEIAGDALGGLVTALGSAEAPVTILALGPLTNIAILLLSCPALKAKIKSILWMGGAVTGGNHTAAAEFNAACDPEALAIVLESGLPVRMVGLECCRQVTVNATDAAKLRGLLTERGRILADLLDGYVRIASADGSRPQPLYDPVAAAALLDERAVAFIPAHVTVERAGALTRGMTVCEFRTHRATPNVLIARSALQARIIDRMLAVFTRAATGSMSGIQQEAAG